MMKYTMKKTLIASALAMTFGLSQMANAGTCSDYSIFGGNGISAANSSGTANGGACTISLSADTVAKLNKLETEVKNGKDGIDALSEGAVMYDDADAKDKVTLNPKSTSGATLANLKDGSVAAGSKDAVNGGQLFDVKTTADKAVADAAKAQNTANTANTKADKNTVDIAALRAADALNVKYDSLAKDKVTLGGANGATVAGVKAATLAADSTEAVNGAQLFDTNQRVADNSRRITVNEGDIKSIINGEKGLVQTDGTTTTVDKAGTSTTIVLAGAKGDRTVSGVKAGTLAADSTEAVNGAQLFDTNQKVADNSRRITVNEGNITKLGNRTTVIEGKLTDLDGKTDKLGASVAANLGGGAAYNQTTGTVSAPSYTVAGGKHSNVGSAFAAVDGKLNQHSSQITHLDKRVTVNEGDIKSIIKGEKGLVQTDGKTTTIDKTGTSTVINVAGAKGDRVITGVANGTAPTDAVNKGQVDAAIGKLVAGNNGRFDQLSERIDANRKSASQGIAAAMAMDIEYPAQHPGEWATGVGMGTYDGQTSLGVGVNYLSRSGKIKVYGGYGQALTSGSRPAAKVGIGFVF